MSNDAEPPKPARRDASPPGEPGRTLEQLGWSAHFAAQLDTATGSDGARTDVSDETLARVSDVHRDAVGVSTVRGDAVLGLPPALSSAEIAVGDWVRIDPDHARVVARLARRTALRRRAAGDRATDQVIAANVDTLFVVSSCNAEFNPARLERYLALAASGDILPVVVLTKADLADDAEAFARDARRLSPIVTVLALDARDADALEALDPWLRPGETAALVGSSGVGKSTIMNGLAGARTATAAIREDDARGRHTTTARSLRPARGGAWLIDTPGMRELGLVDAADGIERVFADLVELAARCRFPDCGHDTEPGCAVRAAIANGAIDTGRLERWRKLEREDRVHTRSVAETRESERRFTRGVKSAMGAKRARRDDRG